LTEEWFMLWLLYCLPLLFMVWHRSGSCCGCYIVYHYCLWFDTRSGSCCCYIVYHYCLWFDRVMVHVVVAIWYFLNVYGLTEECVTVFSIHQCMLSRGQVTLVYNFQRNYCTRLYFACLVYIILCLILYPKHS
jgi:hypothetical protein